MSNFLVLYHLEPDDPSDPIVEREIFHEERQMWCAVENRPASTVGDTDKFWCFSAGHEIGPEGCYFRTVLVVN